MMKTAGHVHPGGAGERTGGAGPRRLPDQPASVVSGPREPACPVGPAGRFARTAASAAVFVFAAAGFASGASRTLL